MLTVKPLIPLLPLLLLPFTLPLTSASLSLHSPAKTPSSAFQPPTDPLLLTREFDASGQCIEYVDGDGSEGDYIDPNADGGYQGALNSVAGGSPAGGDVSGLGAGAGAAAGGGCENGDWKCEGGALKMCHWGTGGTLRKSYL